jgi:hypothetical protein
MQEAAALASVNRHDEARAAMRHAQVLQPDVSLRWLRGLLPLAPGVDIEPYFDAMRKADCRPTPSPLARPIRARTGDCSAQLQSGAQRADSRLLTSIPWRATDSTERAGFVQQGELRQEDGAGPGPVYRPEGGGSRRSTRAARCSHSPTSCCDGKDRGRQCVARRHIGAGRTNAAPSGGDFVGPDQTPDCRVSTTMAASESAY